MRRSIAAALFASLFAAAAMASQQPAPQYPVMEAIATKLIQKYQGVSCQQLWAEKTSPPSAQQAQTQDKAVQLLRQDPAMRKVFIERVAAPIVNKMFDCGMIP